MPTINLSQLLTHDHFFTILQEENLQFDWIISDVAYTTTPANFLYLDEKFTHLATKIKKSDRILLILDQIGAEVLLEELKEYENLILIHTNEGLGSITHKISPSLSNWLPLLQSDFSLTFPFDENQFFMALQKSGRISLHLSNQEIPENIYTFPEDEELSFIDKALAEQPEIIALIDNEQAATHILGMGSYFEEAVKLSQHLLSHAQAYHFTLLAQLSSAPLSKLAPKLKKAQKLILLLDQLASPELIQFFAQSLNISAEKIIVLSPEYEQLTTTLIDYQLWQTHFDAEGLAHRIQALS